MSQPASPPNDLIRIILVMVSTVILVLGSLWVLYPFFLGFLWACMVTIATWPLLIWLDEHLEGRRWLSTTILTLCWLVVFFLPIVLGVVSLVESGETLSRLVDDSPSWNLPTFDWLAHIPVVGERLLANWELLLQDGGRSLYSKIQPHLGETTTWFLSQMSHVGMFIIHALLTLAFTALFYMTGESISYAVRHFSYRISPERGIPVVILITQSVRAVALGVVVTALVQAGLGSIGLALAGIDYIPVLTILLFILCLAQLGVMPILIPCAIYLYWHENYIGAGGLLVWGIFLITIDNFLRPFLIGRGAHLPFLLVFGGVLGGLLAFGMLGLFLGPVILAVTWTLICAWVNEVELPKEAASGEDAEDLLENAQIAAKDDEEEKEGKEEGVIKKDQGEKNIFDS